MSTIFYLERPGLPPLTAEDLGPALFCEGSVFLWKEHHIPFFSDSRCWGYDVSIPEGSFYRSGFRSDEPFSLQSWEAVCTLASDGACVEIIRIVSEAPLLLECVRYLGVDAADDSPCPPSFEEFYVYHTEGDGVVVTDYNGPDDTILIPARLNGRPVLRAELEDWLLPQGCTAFIVSKEVEAVDVRFDDVWDLTRLELPDSVRLLSPPDHIASTRWFLRQPAGQPVYLGGYYCGTPDPNGQFTGELILREGTVGVASCADFRCYRTSITFPDSLTRIGTCAFMYCPCLETVSGGKNLDQVGDCVFWHSEHLTLEERLRPLFPGVPSPLPGRCRAYPAGGPLHAAGRSFSHISAVQAKAAGGERSRDCYGQPTLSLRRCDPQILTGHGTPFIEQFWYLHGPMGLTQITTDSSGRVLLVWDGIPLTAIPGEFRDRVSGLFFTSGPEK